MRSLQMSSAYDELAAFRRSHAIRTHEAAGHVWDVIATGAGDRTIVLLPAAGGSSESQFQLIRGLEPEMRVLSIGCPGTLTTVRQAVDAIRMLLDEYDVSECVLLGQSLGGIFSQAFAMTYPERVQGLILANVANYSVERGAIIRAILKSARHLPKSALITLMRARLKRLLKGHPDREFWVDYFTHDELRRLGNEGIANRGACIGDSIAHRASGAAKRYQGPTLLVESDNDTAFTIAERKAFRASYPHARVHTFHGAGHLSSITRHDEFVSQVLHFVVATAPSRQQALH
jgi:pimeloyl-ACP methyl ester carboxylesterase